VTLKLTAAGMIPGGLNPALVVRLSKSRIKFLSFNKPFYRVWKPTDASAEQSVEDELQVYPIGGMAYVDCDRFLEAPAKLADITCG
jgi:hypothetical protein